MKPRAKSRITEQAGGSLPQGKVGPPSGSRSCRKEYPSRSTALPSRFLGVLTPTTLVVGVLANVLGMRLLAVIAGATFAASLVLETVSLVRVLIVRARGPRPNPSPGSSAADAAQMNEGVVGGHGEDVSVPGPARLSESAQDARPTQPAQDGQDRAASASAVPAGTALPRTDPTLGPSSGAAGLAAGLGVGKRSWRVLRVPLVANGLLVTAFAVYLWVHPTAPPIVRISATIGAVLMWMFVGWTLRTER